MEFNGRKSQNKKSSTFPKYEDLWWKGRVAFLFWKGSSIKESMIFNFGSLVGKVAMVLGVGVLGSREFTIYLGKFTLGRASWLQG